MSKNQTISISCQDGITIAGTLYSPQGDLKGAVMIGPATGIKQQFYANFAQHLADSGFGVLTYDNRGIGASLTGKVGRSRASLQCWGEQDMPAAFTALQQAFPDTKYHLIGHSAGGQLFGLMEESQQLTSLFTYASSSGRLKNMPFLYRMKARFFMDVFIPLSNLVFGHTKSQWVGMGEPLPAQVAQQWREWCNGQGYVKTAFGKTVETHWYEELNFPSCWVNAVDDYIAINANVDDMLSVLPKLPAERVILDPKDHSLNEIGHMKFFSRKSSDLWRYATDWLEKHS